MSRIGKEPVTIPAGVTVDVKANEFVVKGPLGTLVQDYDPAITIKVENGVATLTRANDLGPIRAKHGLYRALLFNMVTGVTNGFEKVLVVNGVGWKVAMQGKKLVMNVGYSHPVEMEAPEGVTLACPSQTEISVFSLLSQGTQTQGWSRPRSFITEVTMRKKRILPRAIISENIFF